MFQRRILKYLTFVIIVNWRFQCVRPNTNEVLDNLHYNADEVTWFEADERCSGSSSTLLTFNPSPDRNNHNISVAKRSVHMHPGDESWVGDYTTYEVISGHGEALNISEHLCVAIHISLEKELNQSAFYYKYDVLAVNCTSQFKGLCINKHKTLTISRLENSWKETRSGCSLWIPEYTTLPVAEGDVFARGNFTASKGDPTLIGESFWINLLVTEIPSVLPVVGNMFRCGFIKHTCPDIFYTVCNQKKNYICQGETSSTSKDVTNGHRSAVTSGSHSAGLYAGVSVTLVIVVTVAVSTVIIVLRKRRHCGDGFTDKLPHGGTSFTKRNQGKDMQNKRNDDGGFNLENRVTTYNQIDLDHVKSSIPVSDVKESRDSHSPEYATIDRTRKQANRPDVVPRNSDRSISNVGRPGYLSMHGVGANKNADDVDKEYDVIDSRRSVCCIRHEPIDRDKNVYSLMSEAHDPAYDMLHRGSSQKRLIKEEYDHVMVEGSSDTMNKRTCDSIDAETHPVVAQTSQPRFNPAYDKVTIQ